jgi:uncharacterized protein
MKPIRFFSAILMIFTFLVLQGSVFAEEIKIPAPVGDIYVQDFANALTETEKAELRNIGRTIEDKTTAQVAVLTVDSIGEVPIEDFANEAFRSYGIGDKQEDNGVLLVLAMAEKKIRIEVGYGLEGRIPDGKAGRILDEYAIPFLKNQQPNKAIVQTYKVLANEVLGEYGEAGMGTVEKAPQVTTNGNQGIGISTWLLIIIAPIVIFLDFKFFGGTLTRIFLFILSRGGRGGGGGSRGGGGGSSGGGGASRGW